MKNLKEDFIFKAILKHGNKYDYSLVEYENNKTKVKIICKEHGIFEQTPNTHLRCGGCYKCGHKNISTINRLTDEEFLFKLNELYGDKYDYSLTKYLGYYTEIKIICKEHGEFKTKPNTFLKGHGCNKCSKCPKTDINSFLEKSKLTHGDKYDYSLVNYIIAHDKVIIICKEHGEFLQTPHNHINKKHGCPKCAGIILDQEEFINKSKEIHGSKYDYSLVEYINSKNKVNIICPTHGIFLQQPCNHLQGQSCPKCTNSKGANKIYRILENNNILYQTEKSIKGCYSPKKFPLKFDIFIPLFNMYIEYDGIQHYQYTKIWGGEESFNYRKICDKIKDDFCKDNNIPLYRISYKDNIEEEINKILNNKIYKNINEYEK